MTPLDECNHIHLNRTLPTLMDEMSAAYIGLYGWDQRTKSKGKRLGASVYRIQKQEPSFEWRFSLHPALWNLEAFLQLLRELHSSATNPSELTAWAFERRAGRLDTEKHRAWNEATFRVCGLKMLGGKHPFLRARFRQAQLLGYSAARLITKVFLGR